MHRVSKLVAFFVLLIPLSSHLFLLLLLLIIFYPISKDMEIRYVPAGFMLVTWKATMLIFRCPLGLPTSLRSLIAFIWISRLTLYPFPGTALCINFMDSINLFAYLLVSRWIKSMRTQEGKERVRAGFCLLGLTVAFGFLSVAIASTRQHSLTALVFLFGFWYLLVFLAIPLLVFHHPGHSLVNFPFISFSPRLLTLSMPSVAH